MARDDDLACFSIAARYLLDPQHYLAKKYPDLHRILQFRLETAYVSRNNADISRCTHHISHDSLLGRTDGSTFQEEEHSAQLNYLDPILSDSSSTRVDNVCDLLADHVEIYGMLGCGTFGAVYLARERQDEFDIFHGVKAKHYAVKVERHTTLTAGKYVTPAPVAAIYDNAESARFIPTEALYLLFLSHSPRFPKLDSVYVHDRFQSIVMSACVDPALDRRNWQSGDYASRFPAFVGGYLMSPDQIPLLDEMAACKVASQLLEGIVEMTQLNLVHSDISVNNFIVDPQLNVQLIDLGNVVFGLEDRDFYSRKYTYLPFQEYQVTPELIEVILRPENEGCDWSNCQSLRLPHDVRQTLIWKYGTIVYGLLHGYWPWDNYCTEYDTDLLHYDGTDDQRVNDRRRRILYEDLPIHEQLSQDCKDVLRHLFQKDPTKRPTLGTLVSYPWFTQWKYHNRLYERPFSKKFQASFSETM